MAPDSMARRQYLKPDEAGAMIAVSPKTLANWRASGYGPPWYRVGGAVRARNGKLEWRFEINGHEYSHITDLEDTERNRIKAQRLEAKARELVLEGRDAELRLQVQPFNSAAEAFKKWTEGEYSEHPNSWKRLAVSMASAEVFFGKRPLSSVTRGDMEDFKAWRRTVHKVREVTLRHDLHALSLLFQYGQKHNWCRVNPVREVEIPSDKEAVRIHVLTPVEEGKYSGALEVLRQEKLTHKRPKEARGLEDLHDLATLMLNQGCRPEELRALPQSEVDLERSYLTILRGKSDAARRSLLLTTASRDVLKTPATESGALGIPKCQESRRAHRAMPAVTCRGAQEGPSLVCAVRLAPHFRDASRRAEWSCQSSWRYSGTPICGRS